MTARDVVFPSGRLALNEKNRSFANLNAIVAAAGVKAAPTSTTTSPRTHHDLP